MLGTDYKKVVCTTRSASYLIITVQHDPFKLTENAPKIKSGKAISFAIRTRRSCTGNVEVAPPHILDLRY